MRRRKFLTAVGSLAAGSAAMMATGATDSYLAARDVSAEVVTDSDLQVTPNEDSDLIETNSPFSVNFDGLENDAYAEIRPAFTVGNNTGGTLYVEIDNPLADSDLSDGGVDIQFIADLGTDKFVGAGEPAVLIDRATQVDATYLSDAEKDSYLNPARIRQTAGGGILRNLTGAKGPGQGGTNPQYVELHSGESFDVIARAIAVDAEDYSASGEVAIEGFNDESNTSLPDGISVGSSS